MIPIEAGHITQRVDINEEVYPNMPPLNLLKDQQVTDVLTWIRNNFAYKASDVKRKGSGIRNFWYGFEKITFIDTTHKNRWRKSASLSVELKSFTFFIEWKQ